MYKTENTCLFLDDFVSVLWKKYDGLRQVWCENQLICLF